jgi:arylsulfatase A-like enzyme
VLRHVLLADDFVSAEIRRNGLVGDLVVTLLAFAVPYFVAGIAAAWLARGIVRLRSRALRPPGKAEGWIGTAFVLGLLGVVALFAIVERPANFAGIFWQRGGVYRAVHRIAEAIGTPAGIAGTVVLAAGLLVLAACCGWWRHMVRERRRAAFVTLVVACVAVASASLARRVSRAHDPSRPNVIVLVVDSLRPDRVDGSERASAVAPYLHALSGRAVRFLDARTPCALTYPAIASILTGLTPPRHGIRHLYPERELRDLAEGALPTRLEANGWSTAAVGGYCATPLREIAFGFGTQRTPRSEVDLIVSAVALRGHPWLPAVLRRPWMRAVWPHMRTAVEGSNPADVAHEAVALWDRLPEPFFQFVFFDNPHLPYVPTWPDTLRAADYAGPNRYSMLAGGLVEQVREGEAATVPRGSDVERDNAIRLYDGAVSSVDRAIGDLLSALERKGLSENTLLVLLADHGENLLDAGGPLAHGEAVERDRSTHVPWWLVWPGRLAPRAVESPVLVTDVAPTILDLLGLLPMEGIDGVSRAEEARGRPGPPERPALFETGMWFFAREVVGRLDPGGRALEYPSFLEGLLEVEAGETPHIVVAPEHRDAVIRAKHRRLEFGPWALTYVPRVDGPSFRLYRRDLDPFLTEDLSGAHPDVLEEMVVRFYEEAARTGDGPFVRGAIPAPSPTIKSPASEIHPPVRRGSVLVKATSISLVPSGTGTTIRPSASQA